MTFLKYFRIDDQGDIHRKWYTFIMILFGETTKARKLIQTHYIAKVLSESFKLDSPNHCLEDVGTLLATRKSGSGEEKYKSV